MMIKDLLLIIMPVHQHACWLRETTDRTENCDPDNLRYNEACLFIISDSEHKATLHQQHGHCYKCDLVKRSEILPHSTVKLVFNTEHQFRLKIIGETGFTCSEKVSFNHNGIYNWKITNDGCSNIFVSREPSFEHAPLYALLAIIILLLIGWLVKISIKKGWCSFFKRQRPEDFQRSALAEQAESVGSNTSYAQVGRAALSTRSLGRVAAIATPVEFHVSKNDRVILVDTFRGIAVSIMIFVNYGGGHYLFFQKSIWNGFGIADIVFPWFSWILGVGIVFFVDNSLHSDYSRIKTLFEAFKKSKNFILLGMVASNITHNDLHHFRFPGILQRLGVAYFVIAGQELLFMKEMSVFQPTLLNEIFRDLIDSWQQWMVTLLLVLIHTIIIFTLNEPGCPKGYLGPGGLHDHGKYSHCTGGATGYIDRLVFGNNHIAKNATTQAIYQTTVPFDSEGLLGILTTIFCVHLGTACGRVILCHNTIGAIIKRWCIWSCVSGLLAGILTGFSRENGIIPSNRNLLSISLILIATSIGLIVLMLIFLLIDYLRVWSGTPFCQAGINAIVIFVAHSITQNIFPWSWKPLFGEKTHLEYLVMNVGATGLWLIIAVCMDKKNIRIQV